MAYEKGLESFFSLVASYEGGRLHKNSGETDITTGYGIYRAMQGDAPVWDIYDEIALSIGITTPSSEWTHSEITKVNEIVTDPSLPYKEREFEATVEFYESYFKRVNFEGVPNLLKYAYRLIYVNSNKIANKALQSTYNIVNKKIGTSKQLVVDGKIGSGSKAAFTEFSDILDQYPDVVNEYTLVAYFISYCKTFYIDISIDEIPSTGTDKHLKFLNGWDNRCNSILETLSL